MNLRRARNAALLSAMAIGLCGCVAVAIPVAAGGVLASSATDGIDTKSDAAGSAPISGVEPIAPPPAAATAEPAAPRSNRAIGAFIAYSLRVREQQLALSQDSDSSVRSAILREPSALNGERAECLDTAPTVLIDLDPAGALFSASTTLPATPQLSEGLETLRAHGVNVAWISGASAAYAGDFRAALSLSALDPASTDTLILMRYPRDRKQTRREALAASSCLIAIAGDERADFDELFDHLKSADAALALERIIDDGWFLIPSLVEPSPSPPTPISTEEPEA